MSKIKRQELVKVYEDLERTLKSLRKTYEEAHLLGNSLSHINVRALITQLSRSKKRLERKIGNTILLEKQQIERKIRSFVS